MKEKDSFINWYQERFNKLNEPPPEEVWNAISQNLSINEAWQGIDAKLTSLKRRKTIRRRSLYAISLLLLLFISGNLILNLFEKTVGEKALAYKNNNSKPITKINSIGDVENQKIIATQSNSKKQFSASIARQSKQPETTNPVNLSENNSTKIISSSLNKNEPEKGFVKPTIALSKTPETNEAVHPKLAAESVNEKNYESGSIITTNSNEELTIMPIRPFIPTNDTPLISLTKIQPNTPDTNYALKQSSIDSKFRGWYGGGIYSINNVWLLNNQTFNGLTSNTLDETNINSGNSYGVSAGYGFSNKWAAELNWYLQSHQGQTYHIYEEGKYLSKNISLNYTVVNLSLRQRKTGYTKWLSLLKSQGIIVGINYGYLKNAKEICGSTTEITNSNYHVSDFGLRFGYGYEILAYNKILFSAGLHTDIGLNNIYSGTDFIPGNFNRTHTASLGFQLGVKYLFR